MYGGYGAAGQDFATSTFPADDAVENSGSLTGHILAQGWADTPARSSNTTKAVVVLAVALGVLVGISLLVVLFAGDAIGGLFDGLAGG